MTGLTPVRAPKDLGREGKRLWRVIARQVAEDEAALDARETEWLRLACREADDLAGIEDALVGQPRTVRGAQGQLVAHPLIGEVRRSRNAIAAWLSKLDLVDPDAALSSGRGSRTTSTSARHAALIRQYRQRGIGA